MPALRKNRKSRTSTPYAAPTESQEQGPREMTQTTLDAWKEPAPQNPQPNSEDHGSPRHALLENMAPLGSLPSTGIRQRVRGLGEAIGRSSLFSRSNGVSGEEAASTPEVTPAPEPEQDDSEIQDEEEAHTSYGGQGGEEEDDDYMPTKGKKNAKAKTPVKVKSPVQSKTTVHNKTPTKNGTRKASTAPPISATQKGQHPYADGVSEQRMQIAVNDAISRCNESNKQILGTAILEVFDDSKSDNNLATALDAIVRQKGDPSHWETFRINIKSRKRRIKRDVEKKKKKKQDKRGSGVTHGLKKIKEATRSRVRRLSRKASSEVAPEDSSSAGNALEDVVPAGSPSKPVDSATEDVMESASRRGSVQAPPHPLTTAPTLPAAESVSEPTTRLPSKSPRKQTITNGDHATATSLDANGTASTTAPTPAAKTPDSGTGSDSELSEVNEEIVQKGPPEPVKANGKSAVAASTAPVPKKGKNTIGGRGGKKTRGGASKQYGKNERRQPPTPEELAEQDNIERKRQAYAESQLVRQVELNIPVSDIRFDDEILETESLTESQIAVGPPVDSTRPRRAGRAPRKDAKRLREDDSRVSSPQLESSATTRPSTPVFHGPKRIKLNNGQAARTKQSPVKNRDGPIAGIPHTGGGGSRQLGPDDNDPSSPQSDSDDLCSACKGAGKFVCCEDCPRVFHLICCDPPLESPPDGPYYCPECLVKRNRAEDPAPESGGRLGPLFKSLESINPRSFVLPTDIQEFFDGVSARPDGSYHEEVKKFPLPKASGYGHQKPDYCRPFDADGNVILCCQCGLSSQGNRPILKCDFCTAYWHLDCLNPPLANPPYIDNEATHRDAWRCPRHIEHDLRSGKLVQNDLNETEKDAEMTDATSYERVRRVPRKVRMPRKPEIVEPTFTRGTRNNGLIDIMNDSEDETDGEGNYVFNLDEPKDMNSKLFRLPEKGIVLDFVSKVKSGRIEKKTENRKTAGSDKSARAAAQRKSIMQNFAAHPIQQQQAALNLARLANKEKDIGLSESNVDALILGLTAEAPTEVVTSISNAPPPPVADDERAQLLKLQELIQRRLNG